MEQQLTEIAIKMLFQHFETSAVRIDGSGRGEETSKFYMRSLLSWALKFSITSLWKKEGIWKDILGRRTSLRKDKVV